MTRLLPEGGGSGPQEDPAFAATTPRSATSGVFPAVEARNPAPHSGECGMIVAGVEAHSHSSASGVCDMVVVALEAHRSIPDEATSGECGLITAVAAARCPVPDGGATAILKGIDGTPVHLPDVAVPKTSPASLFLPVEVEVAACPGVEFPSVDSPTFVSFEVPPTTEMGLWCMQIHPAPSFDGPSPGRKDVTPRPPCKPMFTAGDQGSSILGFPLSSPIVWLPVEDALRIVLEANPADARTTDNTVQSSLAFYVRWRWGLSSAANPPLVQTLTLTHASPEPLAPQASEVSDHFPLLLGLRETVHGNQRSTLRVFGQS